MRFVFKPKRRIAGKSVTSPFYSGRFRLAGDKKPTEVRLRTRDKQVAESKLKKLVDELEQEREGLIAPKSVREGLQKPLSDQADDYVAELRRLGRNEQYVSERRAQIAALASDCSWRLTRDVTRESFCEWRQRQPAKSPKTLNEYLVAVRSMMNWLERAERIPRNPLREVEKVADHGEPSFQRRALTLDEARRLVALKSVRRIVYLVALDISEDLARVKERLAENRISLNEKARRRNWRKTRRVRSAGSPNERRPNSPSRRSSR
jgi:hypothetical protein